MDLINCFGNQKAQKRFRTSFELAEIMTFTKENFLRHGVFFHHITIFEKFQIKNDQFIKKSSFLGNQKARSFNTSFELFGTLGKNN